MGYELSFNNRYRGPLEQGKKRVVYRLSTPADPIDCPTVVEQPIGSAEVAFQWIIKLCVLDAALSHREHMQPRLMDGPWLHF
jgi:hypothetical protein